MIHGPPPERPELTRRTESRYTGGVTLNSVLLKKVALAAGLALVGLLITGEGLLLLCSFGILGPSDWRSPARAIHDKIWRVNSAKPCRIDNPADCPAELICANTEPDRAQCFPRYVGPTPFIRFPFEPGKKTICTQGPENLRGAHSFVSTMYALDLMTIPKDGLPNVVHSVSEGAAIVYQSCQYESSGSRARDDDCGGRFGNHVRVLSPDGKLVLYAHLGPVWVQDGQVIKVGEPIGKEGNSGRAPHRHLHLSVHTVPSSKLGTAWLETLYYYRTHPGEVPPSIPFEIQYCDPANQEDCQRVRSRVEKIPCKLEDFKQPPMRADWRE